MLEMVGRRAARFVYGDYRRDHSVTTMMEDLEWETLSARRDKLGLSLFERLMFHSGSLTINFKRRCYQAPRNGHCMQFSENMTEVTQFPYLTELRNCLLTPALMNNPVVHSASILKKLENCITFTKNMLERLAAWVLNNYLGQYVENLNTDQLSIGLLKGEVELESLPLKKDALNSLDLSIEVRAGFLGKIRLKIPVTRLRTDPWEIFIDKLYLVAGPILPSGYDEEKEQEANQYRKLAKLDLMEAKWRSQQEAKQEASYYASSYSSWVSYGTSLASNVIENLQLTIQDVHIRYEDNLSNPKCPFAWGLTIGSLVAQNTNEKLNFQGGLHNITNARQKLVDLTNLSCYWDLNAAMIGTLPMAELQDAMKEVIIQSDLREYILEPVSATAKLIRNPSPSSLRSRSSPRIICDLQLHTFPVSLNEAQYDSMITWVYEFERMEKIHRYRKWHPQVEVHGHAREWWQFAVQPHLSEIRQKHQKQNWAYILQRAKDNVLYVKAYIEHLKNPVTCPVALKNHKDDVEQELAFEDLKMLREIAMAKISSADEELRMQKQQTSSSGGMGILQRWFPLWSGWYPSASNNSNDTILSESNGHEESLLVTGSNEYLEEEILDALANNENDTLFRRDVVFAKLNFLLKHSSFIINKCATNSLHATHTSIGKKPLFELEFEDVLIELEMRPRLGSTMFAAKLGALYLRDKVMDGSLFPLLIAPQNRESSGPAASIGFASTITNKFKMLSSWASATNIKKENEEPLFELTYEIKPLDSTADARLHVKSQSLDVVYNSEAFNYIFEFFNKPHQKYRNQPKYELALAARSQYEKLKQQTKDELLKNYGLLLSGEQSLTQQRWNIHLDISAPRIIFPDSFYDENATIVVCDFGRLQFSNYSSHVEEKPHYNASLSDDEDDFKTPCSTPPENNDPNSENKQSFHPTLSSIQEGVSQCDITEASLHKNIYDRYSLDFLDLQVLVCEAKNSLKYAYVQGTSTMHVLDRFSISLLLERRTVYTSDPQWPSITLSGSLPRLVVHVNEHKIHALKNCFSRHSFAQWVSSSATSSDQNSANGQIVPDKASQHFQHGIQLETISKRSTILSATLLKEEDAKMHILVLMQFGIGKMCVDVQSRGRSIAELQVSGIKSNFTQRPYDTSVSLTVHSLLLVDALQTFGSDFELLVASHKNISMDSVSGSIRDSEPNSPTSPASPTTSYATFTSPSAINAALKSLQIKESTVLRRAVSPPLLTAVSPSSSSANVETSFSLPPIGLTSKQLDAEALITIEFETIMPELHGNSDCTTNLISVQFNALDIIANQETMVELLGFIMQVVPTTTYNKESQNLELEDSRNVEIPKSVADIINTSSSHLEVTFDFNRLSVLFLKTVSVEGIITAQKVATATMTGACIQAKFDSVMKVEGSLGGLQVLDLVPDGAMHSRILSVGCDPFADCQVALIDQLQADLYKSSLKTSGIENSYNDRQAFNFSFFFSKKSKVDSKTSQIFTINENTIELRIASVFYIHSPRFIIDLASCASEFKQYTTKLMASLKVAAVEVADRLAEGIFPGGKKGRGLLVPPSSLADVPSPLHDFATEGNEMDIKLDVLLETPVIIIPESAFSTNVLVAHLGRITIKNDKQDGNEYTSFTQGKLFSVELDKSQRITIEIRDMNLHSLNIEHNLPMSIQKQWKMMAKPQDVYTCMKKGFPILHDTLIKLIIDHSVGSYILQSTDEFPFVSDNCPMHFTVESPKMHMCELYSARGEVVTPLKVSLSKEQYKQIMRTMATLTMEKVQDDPHDQPGSKSHDSETSSPEQAKTHGPFSEFNRVHVGFEVKVLFELPEFTVELFGDLADMKRGLVSLSFKDLLFNFETQDMYVSNIEATLKSLIMEDLLQDPESKHRFLMLSSSTECENDIYKKPRKSEYLSSSCPDVSTPSVILASQHSLPDKLNTENVFHNFHRIKEKKMYGGYLHKRPLYASSLKSDGHCPRTPPPSPFGMREMGHTSASDALVHIKILFVNSNSKEFATRYNSINRLVDINFNSLDTIINLQSWVVVFDFFGIGDSTSVATSMHNSSDSCARSTAEDRINKSEKLTEVKINDVKNIEMEIQVKNLCLILIMNDLELAKANIANFEARVLDKSDRLSIQGKLGNMSLLDLSAQGRLYRERFLTVGNEALDFHIVKFGPTHLVQTKHYDAKVKLNMSSVHYIHTHRFWTEIVGFFQHFSQLRDIMAKLRATAAGVEMPQNQRGYRVLLNIQVNSPVIVIPVSSLSTKVLVADLGQLKITNEFLPAGAQGTKSVISQHSNSITDCGVLFSTSSEPFDDAEAQCGYSNDEAIRMHDSKECPSSEACLLDVTHIHLLDIDLYAAERQDRQMTNYRSVPTVLEFPTHIIQKQGQAILTEKCKLDLQMESNMDKEWNHSVADLSIYGILSAVHGLIDLNQYMIIRGILEHNLGEQFDNGLPNGEVVTEKGGYKKNWTQLSFHLDLVNVLVEFLSETPLAKVNFIKSRLTYERVSNNSKDIDLVSQEILISDTRYCDYPANSKPNVFCNILQPTKDSKTSVLQAELHYRLSHDTSRLTVLLNNMQLIAIFDWWTAVLDFIRKKIQNPKTSSSNTSSVASTRFAQGPSKYAITVSAGVATKTGKVPASGDLPLEIKINITETSIVVVEDSSVWDTNAIILKSTAVVTCRPSIQNKPLSCSLQSLEVFSCILGLEEDTALSIIDPVTVSIDVVAQNYGANGGLLELTAIGMCHTLEISMQDLNIRLSYHDMQMFLHILDSLPLQVQKTSTEGPAANMMIREDNLQLEIHVQKLQDLGFCRKNCLKALNICKGNLNEAALWLTQNSTTMSTIEEPPSPEPVESTNWFIIKVIEIQATSICICIIDDCKDADVPLVETTFSDLSLCQTVANWSNGTAEFTLSADFYNRKLSGWEPLIEPWRGFIEWQNNLLSNGSGHRLCVNIKGDEVLNLNITTPLINIYQNVKSNWTEDYYAPCRSERIVQCDKSVVGWNSHNYKRRSPFVPFALKNSTGCELKFCMTTVASDQLININYDSGGIAPSLKDPSWIMVNPGEVVPFKFEGRMKMRHQDTHELKIHQLTILIDGWQPVAPVSIDKVGVYFRYAKPSISRSSGVHSGRPSIRVVFSVTLEGSAQKLVTVRSALMLVNKLDSVMEIRLENNAIQLGATSVFHLVPGKAYPVALPYVTATIFARPAGAAGKLAYSNPIQWQQVTKPDEIQEMLYVCPLLIHHNSGNYNFCTRVHRDNYPTDEMLQNMKGLPSNPLIQPAHTITFLAPINLVNLLPYELFYDVSSHKSLQGRIQPGTQASLHSVNLSTGLEIHLQFESFNVINNLIIPSGSSTFETFLHALDRCGRMLMLQAKAVGLQSGCSLEVYIFAPYWLINKTGLPLIFKQENVQVEAAGQFSEHEMARSVSPLLFSFSDREAPAWCSMRVGKSVHPDGEPKWCQYFHLQPGIQFRRLRVLSCDSRPDWVYSIGIEVHCGREQYGDVHFVTFTPRFQLNNHSTYRLEFTQKYAIDKGNILDEVRLSAFPKCQLQFHWPRIDLEQLLCAKISDIKNCNWSGGFPIEKNDSFQINIRDGNHKPAFLRVEVILKGATVFVIFTNADNMPSPFRIDNMSEVPITFHQTNIPEERMRICVRPHSCVPYALDEPTFQPLITCLAPGGSSASYNLTISGESKHQLSYENFIYIAFMDTFLNGDGGSTSILCNAQSDDYCCRELVLEVPEGGLKVILSPKEKGKRAQLWRMTSTGMLQHEGSSPPRHMKSVDSRLVLDIADIAPHPDKYVALRLRKPDPRRSITQTWEFTDDGRLCCKLRNLYVQSRDGFQGLKAGNEAVLGPSQPVIYNTNSNGIPVEQSISRQRLWPGSGLLGVKIIHDGPTLVLQIIDIRQKSLVLHHVQSDWTFIEDNMGSNYCDKDNKIDSRASIFQYLKVKLSLPQGLGISLISSVPEELIYAQFMNITFEYTQSPSEQTFDGSIQNFQMDNQLKDAECPVLLYVTPMSKYDQLRHLPAIHFQVIQASSSHTNVEIYKILTITVKNLTMQIEERLLLKFLQFISYGSNEEYLGGIHASLQESNKFSQVASTALAKRYYFDTLKLALEQVRLSVITSSKLSSELKAIKKQMGLRLVQFEDALVELNPYIRSHLSETRQLLIASVVDHYKSELKSQAAKILGAIDFLGNPLGLVNDVSEGLSGFFNEGNVGGLLKNVTHGLSNSAVKVTETLSEGLGVVTMDDKHQEKRKKIRAEHRGGSGEQLVAGFKGFGFGLYSGITSIVTQTYAGATSEGIPGFFSGFGKGLLGTITKPAVGVLDLATSAASAVRETSRSNYHIIPPRLRLRRLCIGPGGLLPKYSAEHSLAQELLYNLNKNHEELFIALEVLSYSQDGLCALVSSMNVYFLSQESNTPTTQCVLSINFSDLYHCKMMRDIVGSKILYYLELTTRAHHTTGITSANENHCKKPKVLCDTELIAQKVSQKINYAKGLYEEMVHSLLPSKYSVDETYSFSNAD